MTSDAFEVAMPAASVRDSYLRALQDIAEESSFDDALQAAALTIEYLLASSSRGFSRNNTPMPLVVPATADQNSGDTESSR